MKTFPPPHGPKSKFNLQASKAEGIEQTVSDIMVRTNLERWQVAGVLGDLAMQNRSRESQGGIARRWGVSFGEVSVCRNMGKLTINETREMFVTKCIVLGNKALDALADDMNDPVKLAAIRPKDLATMAKALIDIAINLENKGGNGKGPPKVSVSDIQLLMQMRQRDRFHKNGLAET